MEVVNSTFKSHEFYPINGQSNGTQASPKLKTSLAISIAAGDTTPVTPLSSSEEETTISVAI